MLVCQVHGLPREWTHTQKKNSFRSRLSSTLSTGPLVTSASLDDEPASSPQLRDCCSKCKSAAASAAACKVDAFLTLQSSSASFLSSGYRSLYAGGDDGAGVEL